MSDEAWMAIMITELFTLFAYFTYVYWPRWVLRPVEGTWRWIKRGVEKALRIRHT